MSVPYLPTGFPSAVPAWRRLFEDPVLGQLVSGVVSVTTDGMPTKVRPLAIVRLQASYGTELYELPPKSRGGFAEESDLKEGDRARIGQWVSHWSREADEFDEGPFAGQVVTVAEIHGEVAKVLLPMFGTEKLTSVHLERLAAA